MMRVPALVLAVILAEISTSQAGTSLLGSSDFRKGSKAEWSPCSLYGTASGEPTPSVTEGKESTRLAWHLPVTVPVPRNSDELLAECGRLTVPLNWARPLSPTNTIQYFVKRIFKAKNKDRPAPHQVWLIQGGPGASGEPFWPLAAGLIELMKHDVDVFVPDHRGTGESSDMEEMCKDARSPTDCYEQINKHGGEYYTATAAARDLIAFIEDTRRWVTSPLSFMGIGDRRASARLSIYGMSYGTYLINRFLHIVAVEKGGEKSLAHPDEVALDGMCPPTVCRMDVYDTNWDYTGRAILTKCLEDKFCARKFKGADPLQLLKDMVASPPENQCTQACPLDVFLNLLGSTVPDAKTSLLPPGLIYRYHRCNDDDAAFFSGQEVAFKRLQGSMMSMTLHMNIVLSEMMSDSSHVHPPSPATLDQQNADTLFRINSASDFARMYDEFPRYDLSGDRHFYKFGTALYNGAVLLMNGDLDPQTPVEWARLTTRFMRRHPRSKYVEVPNAAHGVIMQSKTTVEGAPDCGMTMLATFFGDGLDTTCMGSLAPMDFACESKECRDNNAGLLGGKTLWGDQ